MSVEYRAVSWNAFKKRYDTILAFVVLLALGVFIAATFVLFPKAHPVQVLIRGFGIVAFGLLHFILVIGPLCRLDRRFLPLLYNRRHLGVCLFFLALVHGVLSLVWFHGFSDLNPFISVFVSDSGRGLDRVPFQAFGFVALVILFLMAATSHDFWLVHLTAPVWKALHMMVYLAYGLLVCHVLFGSLRSERSFWMVGVLLTGVCVVVGLHLLAGLKEWKRDGAGEDLLDAEGFLRVCRVSDIPEGGARGFMVGGERVAVVRWEGKLSVLSALCQHQNGPLDEGRVVKGCLTCPWHGYQYLPDTGASPPPFVERVPIFRSKVVGDVVFVHPVAVRFGELVEPVCVPAECEAEL